MENFSCGFGPRAGCKKVGQTFTRKITVPVVSTRPSKAFRPCQRPVHRIEMIVGNAGRIAAAELRLDDGAGGGRLRTHYSGENSSC